LAKQEESKRKRKEIQRRQNPQTKQDFNVLYQDINIWREEEAAAIKNSTKRSEDKFLQLDLLYKQIRLLQVVDSLKKSAKDTWKCSKVEATLDQLASPQTWLLKRNTGFIKVYTDSNIRAKQLEGLYIDLIEDVPCEFSMY